MEYDRIPTRFGSYQEALDIIYKIMEKHASSEGEDGEYWAMDKLAEAIYLAGHRAVAEYERDAEEFNSHQNEGQLDNPY